MRLPPPPSAGAAQHSDAINGDDDQRHGAEDGRDEPDVLVLQARDSVRPIAEHGRTEPRADPADDDLGAERPDARRHVIFAAIVQDGGDDGADDEQDEKADEIHSDHVNLPQSCLLRPRVNSERVVTDISCHHELFYQIASGFAPGHGCPSDDGAIGMTDPQRR